MDYRNQTCLPLALNSPGVWENPILPAQYILPMLLIQTLLICGSSHLLHTFLKPLPELACQILVGFLFSPTILGQLTLFKTYIFPVGGFPEHSLYVFSFLGYNLLLFFVGLEIDLIIMFQKLPFFIGLISLSFPFIFTLCLQYILLKFSFLSDEDNVKLIHVTHTYSITTVPVFFTLIKEFKLGDSNWAHFGLSIALIIELINSLATNLASIFSIIRKTRSIKPGLSHLGLILIFMGVCFGFVRPVITRVMRKRTHRSPTNFGLFFLFLIAVYKFSGFDKYFFSGAFMLGLAVPNKALKYLNFNKNLDFFVSRVLLPIFVVTSTMRVNYLKIVNGEFVTIFTLMFTLTVKMLFTMLLPLLKKFPTRQAMLVALTITCKGIVEIATFKNFYDEKKIKEETFVICIVSIFFIQTLAAIALRYLVDQS